MKCIFFSMLLSATVMADTNTTNWEKEINKNIVFTGVVTNNIISESGKDKTSNKDKNINEHTNTSWLWKAPDIIAYINKPEDINADSILNLNNERVTLLLGRNAQVIKTGNSEMPRLPEIIYGDGRQNPLSFDDHGLATLTLDATDSEGNEIGTFSATIKMRAILIRHNDGNYTSPYASEYTTLYQKNDESCFFKGGLPKTKKGLDFRNDHVFVLNSMQPEEVFMPEWFSHEQGAIKRIGLNASPQYQKNQSYGAIYKAEILPGTAKVRLNSSTGATSWRAILPILSH